MKKHFKYLSYALRHKWYVMIECFKSGLIWRGIVHDLSKFYPSEWFPYAYYFYGKKEDDISKGRNKTGYYKPGESGDDAFDRAWLFHQHRNPHHWQWWVLTQDEDDDKVLEIDREFMLEMYCDWKGAGRAQKNGVETKEWYEANKNKMKLHWKTRSQIELLIYGM